MLEKLEKRLKNSPVAVRENASEQLEAERKRPDAELQKLEWKRKQPDADECTQARLPKKAAVDGPAIRQCTVTLSLQREDDAGQST